MSVALERLRALSRQAGKGGSNTTLRLAPPGTGPSPVDASGLRSLLRIRQRAQPTMRSNDRDLPGKEIAPGLRFIESHVPSSDVPPHLDGSFACREPIATGNALFFDTETTGLAGGVGTRAFMVGAADWTAGKLRIRQLLITSTGAEPAMLEAFASWLRPETLLVSYNGRSYDAPLLAGRYRLARLPCPLAGKDHLDLLYPTRRRYKGRWENCRLATIERQALGIVREDDLPGSEAPGAWLGYLRGGSAERLRGVLRYNLQDVVTLAGLLRHLGDPLRARI